MYKFNSSFHLYPAVEDGAPLGFFRKCTWQRPLHLALIAVALLAGAIMNGTAQIVAAQSPTQSITLVRDDATDSGTSFTLYSLTGTGYPLFDDGTGVGNSRTLQLDPNRVYGYTNPPKSGWELTGISCVDLDDSIVDSIVTVSSMGVVMTLAAGENLTCTFASEPSATNVDASISIIKDAGGAADNFSFTSPWGPFTLDDASPDDVDGVSNFFTTGNTLSAGSYMVAEDVPVGWALQTLRCRGGSTTTYTYGNDGTFDAGETGVTINLAANEDIVCVFINVEQAPVASCGGHDVYEIAPGQFSAPSFAGNLIIGTEGGDWIRGTSGPDLILGLGGGDDIFGKHGDDIICGGEGVDIVFGMYGDDIIYGDEQRDWLIGGSGDDTIYGGLGNDDLIGSYGRDKLYGEDGRDVLLGGSNDDELFGGTGKDYLFGQSGSDDLDGGSENDYCRGGWGRDSIVSCEGLSAAAETAMDAADIETARMSNDGENGEFSIEPRIKDLFIPFVSQ